MISVTLLSLWIITLRHVLGNLTLQAFPESKKLGCEDLGRNQVCLSMDDHRVCVNDLSKTEKYRCVCESDYKDEGGSCVEKLGCEDLGGNQACISRNDHRVCVNDKTKSEKYKCVCESGYKEVDGRCVGNICERDLILCPEESTICISNGIDDYYCKCLPGFKLKEGNTEDHNKEACIKTDECKFDFPMCPEDSTRCVPKGQNDFYCDCLPGYKLRDGKKVEENKEACIKLNKCEADPTVCPKNISKCVPMSDSFYCECLPGYKHNNQSVDPNNRDICISEEVTDVTETVPTYRTSEASTKPETTSRTYCDCGPNSEECYLKPDGYKMCKCKPGYAQRGEWCEECLCGSNSHGCEFRSYKYKVCRCHSGYAQKGNVCSKTCRYNGDCFFGGLCLKRFDSYFCSCKSGFSGDVCEKNDMCSQLNLACRNKSVECFYTKRFGKGFCDCRFKNGLRSEINTCDKTHCEFNSCVHGRCQTEGHFLQCKCDEGFTGKNCNTRFITVKSYNQGYIIVTGIILIVLISFLCGTLCLCIDIRRLKKKEIPETTRIQNEFQEL